MQTSPESERRDLSQDGTDRQTRSFSSRLDLEVKKKFIDRNCKRSCSFNELYNKDPRSISPFQTFGKLKKLKQSKNRRKNTLFLPLDEFEFCYVTGWINFMNRFRLAPECADVLLGPT